MGADLRKVFGQNTGCHVRKEQEAWDLFELLESSNCRRDISELQGFHAWQVRQGQGSRVRNFLPDCWSKVDVYFSAPIAYEMGRQTKAKLLRGTVPDNQAFYCIELYHSINHLLRIEGADLLI